MKTRFRLFQRGTGIFYIEDTVTQRQESLRTKDPKSAQRLFQARNQAHEQPILNLQLARTYLAASDPAVAERTWRVAMEAMLEGKTGSTRERWLRAVKDRAFDSIRARRILETRAEHFFAVLSAGTVATNVFLRRIHNFVVDLGCLPRPLIPKRQWPLVQFGEKRAISATEHLAILEREANPERRTYYQLLWHLGGSQGDIANLRAEDINWNEQVVSYRRQKTNQTALLHFGDQVAATLRQLPHSGPLFPNLRKVRAADRATEFKQRCRGLGIEGVTLHSYRYAWAERAKEAGYPKRYAMEALGHNSKAVHRAYSRKAQVRLPSLESFESRITAGATIPFPGGAISPSSGGEAQEPLAPAQGETQPT